MQVCSADFYLKLPKLINNINIYLLWVIDREVNGAPSLLRRACLQQRSVQSEERPRDLEVV